MTTARVGRHEEGERAPDLPQGETAFDHSAPGVIAVYNGRDHLGSIAIGRPIRAVRPDGSEIGRFDSKDEARAAIVREAFARVKA